MADLEEFEDEQDEEEESAPTLELEPTNVDDDAGELDYEPSEPAAESIKDPVSDDEEEGQAGDSDQDEQDRIDLSESLDNPIDEKSIDRSKNRSMDDDDDGSVNEERSDRGDDQFSEPEEGEVDDLEEGEVKDESESEDGEDTSKITEQKRRHPQIKAPSPGPDNGKGTEENGGVCKFYARGQCTWGAFCKFLHPGGGDRPQKLESDSSKRSSIDAPLVPTPTSAPVPLMALKTDMPRPLMATARQGSPPSESAWERGLKQARERIKRASEQKDGDPDFERKRTTMPLSLPAVDEGPSIIVDQLSPSGARITGPRPLLDFSRERAGDDAYLTRPPAAPSDAGGRQQYNRDSAHGDFGNGRAAYERRPPPQSAASAGRSSRDPMNDGYSRRDESQERYYGSDRSGQSAPNRSRQPYARDDYQPGAVGSIRSSQDHVGSQPHYQRHSSTSSADHSGGQPYPDRRGGGERDDRDIRRRRIEPEPQGWEYRDREQQRERVSSPPAYYRDRGDRAPDHRAPPDDRGVAPKRVYEEIDRPIREEGRRPPSTQNQQPRSNLQQQQQHQQYRPPNYHFLRTQQQLQQPRGRTGTSTSTSRVGGEQERKPTSDYDRGEQRDRVERPTSKTGRHVYNHHFYQARDRQQQPATAGGRPLPYERPSFTRQTQRDPWRRSTSPGRRGPGAVGGGGNNENRRSSQGKRTPSRDPSMSASPGPAGGGIPVKRKRRGSGSSSISGSSVTSRSSAGDGIRGRGGASRPAVGKGGPKDIPRRSGSTVSSPRQREIRTSLSPADSDRGKRYDRYKRASKERSTSRTGRKEPGDVASRAAAKALGAVGHKDRSPSFDNGSPRIGRRAVGGGGRPSSAAGSKNSGTIARSGERRSPPSPEMARRHHRPSASPPARPAETRPLSPPPPAPFLADAAVRVKSAEKIKTKQGQQQRNEPPRQPIKMTIASKHPKVRTNIYDGSDEEDPATETPTTASSHPIVDDSIRSEKRPLSSAEDDSHSPSPSDEGLLAKKMKLVDDDNDEDEEGGESNKVVMNRREELLRQLRAVEHAIDAKRKKSK